MVGIPNLLAETIFAVDASQQRKNIIKKKIIITLKYKILRINCKFLHNPINILKNLLLTMMKPIYIAMTQGIILLRKKTKVM